jgi:hypothetical protein
MPGSEAEAERPNMFCQHWLRTILAHESIADRRTMGADNQGATEAPVPRKSSVMGYLAWK